MDSEIIHRKIRSWIRWVPFPWKYISVFLCLLLSWRFTAWMKSKPFWVDVQTLCMCGRAIGQFVWALKINMQNGNWYYKLAGRWVNGWSLWFSDCRVEKLFFKRKDASTYWCVRPPISGDVELTGSLQGGACRHQFVIPPFIGITATDPCICRQ